MKKDLGGYCPDERHTSVELKNLLPVAKERQAYQNSSCFGRVFNRSLLIVDENNCGVVVGGAYRTNPDGVSIVKANTNHTAFPAIALYLSLINCHVDSIMSLYILAYDQQTLVSTLVREIKTK